VSSPVSAGARLRIRAPGKVNLCLFLGPVRDDGRHELVTLFESVSLYDELEVSAGVADEVICPGVGGPNLVADALAGLRAQGWAAPPVRVEISKRIPVAAGMGGGSADAAALLRVAPELAPAPDAAGLGALAASLGADVPSQLTPGVVLGTGAGDVVRPVEPLAPHALVIVTLPERLSTAAVYAEADRLGLPRGRDELEARLVEIERAVRPGEQLGASLVVNDLEPAAMSLCPGVERALEAVREAGADQALVCGSGPTVAGVWWGEDALAGAEACVSGLADRFPAATAVSPVAGIAPAASRASGKI
jgi:4-diphosphocytidyl-2-C-methyl-D-erythritol kinase